MIAITSSAEIQSAVGALSTPAAGSPTVANTASPTTMIAAPAMCRRVITWCVNQWPSGSAHTIEVTRNGWMIATRPRSSAAAWSTTPTTCAARPSSQIPFSNSPIKPRLSPGSTPASIAARCHNVAARAKDTAARRARTAATALTSTNLRAL